MWSLPLGYKCSQLFKIADFSVSHIVSVSLWFVQVVQPWQAVNGVQHFLHVIISGRGSILSSSLCKATSVKLNVYAMRFIQSSAVNDDGSFWFLGCVASALPF